MKALFIGGCERSGTTLLASLIGRHRKCCVTPESQFKIDLYKEFDWPSAPPSVHDVALFLDRNFRYRLWDIGSKFLMPLENDMKYPDLLQRIVAEYKAKNYPDSALEYWIDHTPENIEYAVTLLEMFPEAKFIHLIRDGRGVAASILPLDWGPNTILSCATWWSSLLSYGLALETFLPQEQILRVRYEDLLSDTDEILAKIYRFMELKNESEELDQPEFIVPGYTAKQHHLVGKKIDAGKIGDWKKRLTKRQVELFECRTKNLLNYLGYDQIYGSKVCAPTHAEILKSYLVELVYRKLVNPVKNRRRKLVK